MNVLKVCMLPGHRHNTSSMYLFQSIGLTGYCSSSFSSSSAMNMLA